jgi:OmpA-OmpF porin, OOP family
LKFKLGLLAVTALAAPFAFSHMAQAQPVTGLYVNAEGGLDFQEPVNLNLRNQVSHGQYQTNLGYGGLAGVGYGFGNGFRVQLEANVFTAKIKSINSQANPDFVGILANGHGSELKYGPMIAGYYDFDVGFPIYPYVGAGVGYEIVALSPAAQSTNAGVFTRVGGSKGSFDYMGSVGLAYPLPSVPGLSLTVEYRFMGITGNHNYNVAIIAPSGLAFNGRVKFKSEYDNLLMVGLRYQLFTPPPPAPAPAPAPMAAPAPAPAKTYLVFFDWDRYNLTPRATQIIAQAASDSHTVQTTTIAVSGYTDTSGTPTYNQGLSIRRAKAVAAQLVTDGVPASEITAQGFGDTNLLVPTGPGVREPQNRRVQIVLQ